MPVMFRWVNGWLGSQCMACASLEECSDKWVAEMQIRNTFISLEAASSGFLKFATPSSFLSKHVQMIAGSPHSIVLGFELQCFISAKLIFKSLCWDLEVGATVKVSRELHPS
eukprot:4998231-Amphidinium_carterae.2